MKRKLVLESDVSVMHKNLIDKYDNRTQGPESEYNKDRLENIALHLMGQIQVDDLQELQWLLMDAYEAGRYQGYKEGLDEGMYELNAFCGKLHHWKDRQEFDSHD